MHLKDRGIGCSVYYPLPLHLQPCFAYLGYQQGQCPESERAALEVLGIDEVHASAVATGRGMVRSAHGLIPNPAPAVVGLLQGVPTYGIDVPIELTTPTGAALLPESEFNAAVFHHGVAYARDAAAAGE